MKNRLRSALALALLGGGLVAGSVAQASQFNEVSRDAMQRPDAARMDASRKAVSATAPIQPIRTMGSTVTYSTGFEAPEYTTGNLFDQQGWWTRGAGIQIQAARPATGAQHVDITSAGSPTTANNKLAWSPENLPKGTEPYVALSANLRMSRTGNGAWWELAPQDPVAESVLTRVRFAAAGPIMAVDFDLGQYVETGTDWPADTYFNFKLIAERASGALRLCVDDAQIYEDLTGNATGSTEMEEFIFSQVAGSGQTGNNTLDFDDIVLEYTDSFSCGAATAVTFDVTPSVGAGDGSIAPATVQTVDEGDTASFTLTADAGFQIDNVSGTCGGTLASGVFTTDAVMADCTVIANFKVATDAEIQITPASLSASLETGATGSDLLSIANVGGLPLTWSIDEQSTSLAGVRPRASLLYDQTANATTSGSVAFLDLDDPDYYESQAADDFVVPAGAIWSVEQVFVGGFYSADSPALPTAAANVFIYADDNGAPGAAVASFNDLVPATDSTGSLMMNLPSAVSLAEGTYWISVQPSRDWFDDGPWYWFQNASSNGAEFHWRNPGDGFDTGCVTWGTASDCVGASNADLVFQIHGESSSAAHCDNPADVAWLSVSATSGTTAPADSDDVTVSFNATSLAVGNYSADLCVNSNDPNNALVVVPVSLTVTLPTFSVTSSVGTGDGSITPAGVQSVVQGDVASFTLAADAGFEVASVDGTCGGTMDFITNTYTTDPVTAACTVVAHFQVSGTNPKIDVSPASVGLTAPLGSGASDSIVVANTGGGMLDYSIAEALARRSGGSYATARAARANGLSVAGSLSADPAVGSGQRGGEFTLMATDISQMADNSPGNQGVSCGSSANGTTADNSWWRRFYFNEHPAVGAAASIESVTISTGSIVIPGGLPSTINLYTIPSSVTVDTIPTSQLTLIGTATAVIEGSLTSLTIPVTGMVTDTTAMDLVVEWFTAGNTSGGQFFPGANSTPETHPTFISSETCDISAPLPTAAIGFPDFHLTMVVTVGDAPGCDSPSDVSWLSVSPISGSIAGGADESVAVSASSSGLAVGTYNANLCVSSNDTTNPLVTVPVSFEVTTNGIQHTVTPSVGSGSGTISPATAQLVDEGTVTSFTLTPGPVEQLVGVSGTCGGTLSGNVFTTAPVISDCSVVANFAPLPFPAPYCNVTFPSAVEPISRVVIGAIDNASSPVVGGSPALENFLSVTGGDLSQGGLYEVQVEGNTDGTFTTKVAVYIDWNQDGVFAANELYTLTDLVNSTGVDGKQATGEILVPEDALLGATRMRVIKKFSTLPAPCESAGYGQAEDYTVVINDDPLPLPEADISTGFLNFEAMQGTSDVDAFDVINHGEGRLVFDIRRAWAAGIQVPRTQIGNQAERASLLQTRVNDRERMQAMGQFHTLQRADTVGVATTGVSAGVYLPFGEYISQMASDVPEALNGVACGDSDAGTTSDNSWWRRFYFDEHPVVGSSTRITSVTVSSETGPSTPATINVYTIPSSVTVNTIPLSQLTLVGTGTGTVGGTLSTSSIDLDFPVDILDTDAVDLVIEYHIDGAAQSFYPGGNSSAQTHPTYLSSATCGLDEPVDAAGLGFAEFHIIMLVEVEDIDGGTPGVGCDAPSNVSWLSVNPANGTINGAGSTEITVTANATGLAVGTHEALLCINTNDPVSPRLEIEVSFTVTANEALAAIFKDGFEPIEIDPNLVVHVINQPVVADGDGSTLDFVSGLWSTYNPGRADNINLYDYGNGELTAYWYGDMASVDVGGVVDTNNEFAQLQPGAVIGPDSTIAAASKQLINWYPTSDAYLGIAFENSETGELNYGYIRLKSTGPLGFPAEVVEYGYNKIGQPVTIPSPQ